MKVYEKPEVKEVGFVAEAITDELGGNLGVDPSSVEDGPPL